MKKIVALLLALCLTLGMTAAFAEDWVSYDKWLEEDWTAKEIAYQFSGAWELEEYSMYCNFLVTLYTDGSALVDQRNIKHGSSYLQFGYWSENTTEDGNEITFDTLFCTDVKGEGLIAHEYSYELYEEEDGNYSFGYTFGIAPGQYFRDVDMVGGKEVLYATQDDFHAAVDVPAVVDEPAAE